MTLAQQYQVCIENDSDVVGHLPTFVALVEQLDATQVVELGTRSGISTIAWLYALEGRGHLWSVDLQPAPYLGEYDHWTFLQGDDCSQPILEALPGDVDIVFIDTSHDYQHTLRELQLYSQAVRHGGRILLHDTELAAPDCIEPQAPFPVKRAINTFCADTGHKWTNHEHCFGLGVIAI